MAHSCPACDQVCHCKGDIDDIIFDREPKGGCIHYKSPDCEGNENLDEDYWDEDFDFDEEQDDSQKLIPKDGGLYDSETGITHYP